MAEQQDLLALLLILATLTMESSPGNITDLQKLFTQWTMQMGPGLTDLQELIFLMIL